MIDGTKGIFGAVYNNILMHVLHLHLRKMHIVIFWSHFMIMGLGHESAIGCIYPCRNDTAVEESWTRARIIQANVRKNAKDHLDHLQNLFIVIDQSSGWPDAGNAGATHLNIQFWIV